MDSIFGVIDAQGFFVKDEFYPRELAFGELDDSFIFSCEFDPPMKFEYLSPKEKERNLFIMKYTGLPYECNGYQEDKVKLILGLLREKYWTEDKPNFGIKNNQLATLLKSIGFSFVVINCPPIYTLNPAKSECDRHTLNKDGACAVKKVEVLRKWIKNY
jgi:hypothetical protein